MKNNSTQNSTETQKEDQPDQSNEIPPFPKRKIRIGLMMTIFGYLTFLVGARPGLFNLDRSRVIGFVQISVFLIGLGIIVMGSYITLNSLWPQGKKTIAADIGSRLVSTGYVICVFTSMADIFGLGSHRLPNVFFGPLQAQGMVIGMATIGIGFLLMIRYNPSRRKSDDTHPEETDQTDNVRQSPPRSDQIENIQTA
ncbi:MAG: hypothetical protein SVR81_01735 [Chloroflexota bacterium]|nr:hypothetical protein [Chloroflexota bacterium]